MPPNQDSGPDAGFLGAFEEEFATKPTQEEEKDELKKEILGIKEEKVNYDQPYHYLMLIGLPVMHSLALYALIFQAPHMKLATLAFNLVYYMFGALGITAGAHRYWCHRSYKATAAMRFLLMLMFAASGQNKLFTWIVDHRIHHKFTETPADPYNVKRGFFFAHFGWMMKRKHPSCIEQGKKIDMSDYYNDGFAIFFDKNFVIMKSIFCFIIPMSVMRYGLGESWEVTFFVNIIRWVLILNANWAVNSFAHMFGDQPYNKTIKPTDNIFVTLYAVGEGWHNFHHSFPLDYRAAEFGIHFRSLTTLFIEACAHLGMAYDLKTSTKKAIVRQANRKGDGTRFVGMKDEEIYEILK